jgi:hypothetical protein
MAFFFPTAYSTIDWEQGFDFLDNELQQITREAETGKLIVDKLVKVYLCDGQESWLLLHIEIQNQKEAEFSERVYIYSTRLFDKFRRPVASFAVIGDTDRNWRPSSFHQEALGSKHDFSFQIAKLVDYKQRQEDLQASNNPFAIIVQAHLAAQATKGKASQQRRKQQKYKLATILYERGLSEQQVIDLYRFIHWVLTLPPELEAAFREELETYERGKNMPYISAIEKTGEINFVTRLLNRQLGEISEETAITIKQLSTEQLEQLALDLANFKQIEDLNHWLQQQSVPGI